MGSKSGSWAILGAKIAQEAGKAPPKNSRLKITVAPVARFGQKIEISTSVLGSHFDIFVCLILCPIFEALLGRLQGRSAPILGAKSGARGAPRGAQEQPRRGRSRKRCQIKNMRFAEAGAQFLGLGVAQDEAQLRPRTPFCRPRAFKKEGPKMDPKKERKMTARQGSKNGTQTS